MRETPPLATQKRHLTWDEEDKWAGKMRYLEDGGLWATDRDAAGDWFLAVCEASVGNVSAKSQFFTWLVCAHQRPVFPLSSADPYAITTARGNPEFYDGESEEIAALACQSKYNMSRFSKGTEMQLMFALEMCINTSASHGYSPQPSMQWANLSRMYQNFVDALR